MRYFISVLILTAFSLPNASFAGIKTKPKVYNTQTGALTVRQESGVMVYRGQRAAPSPRVIAAQTHLAQQQARQKAAQRAHAQKIAAHKRAIAAKKAAQAKQKAEANKPKLRGRYGRSYYGNNRFFGPNGFAGNSNFAGASPRTNRPPRRRRGGGHIPRRKRY